MGNFIQTQLYKEMMGSYPTGVTIVTSVDSQGNPIGLTVNSFASVSLDPLLVLWCIDQKASTYHSFASCDKFAVHILAADQKEACWSFAGKEPDRFSKVTWSFSEHHLPIISDSFGTMQCQCVNRIKAGDHTILIGEVISLSKNDKDPMLYFRRNVGAIPETWCS